MYDDLRSSNGQSLIELLLPCSLTMKDKMVVGAS